MLRSDGSWLSVGYWHFRCRALTLRFSRPYGLSVGWSTGRRLCFDGTVGRSYVRVQSDLSVCRAAVDSVCDARALSF